MGVTAWHRRNGCSRINNCGDSIETRVEEECLVLLSEVLHILELPLFSILVADGHGTWRCRRLWLRRLGVRALEVLTSPPGPRLDPGSIEPCRCSKVASNEFLGEVQIPLPGDEEPVREVLVADLVAICEGQDVLHALLQVSPQLALRLPDVMDARLLDQRGTEACGARGAKWRRACVSRMYMGSCQGPSAGQPVR